MRMRCDASRDDDENQKMKISKFHFNFIISHHITSHHTELLKLQKLEQNFKLQKLEQNFKLQKLKLEQNFKLQT
jgi:hypothetical protein